MGEWKNLITKKNADFNLDNDFCINLIIIRVYLVVDITTKYGGL